MVIESLELNLVTRRAVIKSVDGQVFYVANARAGRLSNGQDQLNKFERLNKVIDTDKLVGQIMAFLSETGEL